MALNLPLILFDFNGTYLMKIFFVGRLMSPSLRVRLWRRSLLVFINFDSLGQSPSIFESVVELHSNALICASQLLSSSFWRYCFCKGKWSILIILVRFPVPFTFLCIFIFFLNNLSISYIGRLIHFQLHVSGVHPRVAPTCVPHAFHMLLLQLHRAMHPLRRPASFYFCLLILHGLK